MSAPTCAYCLKGCRCDKGVQEPDCDQVLCGEPATVKIHNEWYCAPHSIKIQALFKD
jgi:hypothetical protein